MRMPFLCLLLSLVSPAALAAGFDPAECAGFAARADERLRRTQEISDAAGLIEGMARAIPPDVLRRANVTLAEIAGLDAIVPVLVRMPLDRLPALCRAGRPPDEGACRRIAGAIRVAETGLSVDAGIAGRLAAIWPAMTGLDPARQAQWQPAIDRLRKAQRRIGHDLARASAQVSRACAAQE